MSAARPLATAQDYSARYPGGDDARVPALLEDASAMLVSLYRQRHGVPYREGDSAPFDLNAKAVCCAMVSRAINAGAGVFGATQVQQTAGSYSASASFAGPTGDLFTTKSDLERLGLSGQRIWSIAPMTAADRKGETDV